MSRASHAFACFGLAFVLPLAAPPAHAADVSVQLDAGAGFSVKDSAGAIERLRVDEATGNVSRNGALFVHTTGSGSTFVGAAAGPQTTGSLNSAFGERALGLNGAGFRNSAFGESALRSNATGAWNSAFGQDALRSNTGSYNSAFGQGALLSNTTGSGTSAFGHYALRDSTGLRNDAFGWRALRYNTSGSRNSAFGSEALQHNFSGNYNVAFGSYALRSNGGSRNSAFGEGALIGNTIGNANVALGTLAGRNLITGSNNIYVANPGAFTNESGQIRIGTVGTHTQTWIAGIYGVLADQSPTCNVQVTPSGHLSATGGTCASSLRFKQDVREIGEASKVLMQLRPVAFRYRTEVTAGRDRQRYGLIAEEVAELAPELVASDAQGEPVSVHYDELPAMLLNELQRQQRTIEIQQRTIDTQQHVLGEQRESIAALADRLGRLEAGRERAPAESSGG